MSDSFSRRRFVGWAGAAATAGVAAGAFGQNAIGSADADVADHSASTREPARLDAADAVVGAEPGGLPRGLADPVPAFGQVLAVDLAGQVRRSDRLCRRTARELLSDWARIAQGPGSTDESAAGVAGLDLRPASLQVAFGVGAGLLERCGLGGRRPESMVDLPSFHTDALLPERCGGDLLVHLGAEDPMRLAGAVQEVVGGLRGRAHVRWSRRGFRQTEAAVEHRDQTARNLMGHRDGTANGDLGSPLWESVVRTREPAGPARWMDGGSYLVVRDIRIDLDRWYDESLARRDAAIGRHTVSGAALGSDREHDPVDLTRRDDDGSLSVPAHAHIRLASSTNTAGARIYRRSWNYDDGWSGAVRDAGLLFLAWQADPRRGFLPIQESLTAHDDALNRYVTHVGSALFAMLPQPSEAGTAGRELFGEDV